MGYHISKNCRAHFFMKITHIRSQLICIFLPSIPSFLQSRTWTKTKKMNLENCMPSWLLPVHSVRYTKTPVCKNSKACYLFINFLNNDFSSISVFDFLFPPKPLRLKIAVFDISSSKFCISFKTIFFSILDKFALEAENSKINSSKHISLRKNASKIVKEEKHFSKIYSFDREIKLLRQNKLILIKT